MPQLLDEDDLRTAPDDRCERLRAPACRRVRTPDDGLPQPTAEGSAVPGLSLSCDLQPPRGATTGAARRALQSVCHDERYAGRVVAEAPSYWLGWSAYPEYPFASYEVDGGGVVHLEGRLYGERPPAAALAQLARLVFASEDGPDTPLARWLRDTDGEFVAVAEHRPSQRVVIVNDVLGRLPLYCSRTPERFVLSREIGFVARLLAGIRFDRMALAQHLALGFPLGERTLLEGVERVAPAACIRIDGARGTLRRSQVLALDLGAGGDASHSAGDLAALFAAACRARTAGGGPNVVSLSGGADSRTIAAGLHRERIPFRCASYAGADGGAEDDVRIARQLADLFGSPWDLFRIGPTRAADHLRLLQLKLGMNPLSMSPLMDYLEQVRSTLGASITFLTGDGGDKVLPDLRPPERHADADEATTGLLQAHRLLPLDEVGILTGVAADEIFAEVRQRLAAHPEDGWARKRVHWEISERGGKWLFEGEDRNRSFFWSTTPFYAVPFFHACMACDDQRKAHRALYVDVLKEISPAAAAIEYAGLGVPFDSRAFRTKSKAVTLLAQVMAARAPRDAATERDGRQPSGAEVAAHMRRQMARCDAIATLLALDRLPDYPERLARHAPFAAHALLTLTSVIEALTSGASSFAVAPRQAPTSPPTPPRTQRS